MSESAKNAAISALREVEAQVERGDLVPVALVEATIRERLGAARRRLDAAR